MTRFAAILLLACPAFCLGQTSHVSKAAAHVEPAIKSGATVWIEPMGGYEIYLASAFMKKRVPLIVVTDKDKAEYIITGTAKHIKPTGPTTVVRQNTVVSRGYGGQNDGYLRGAQQAARQGVAEREAERVAFGYYITDIAVIDPQSSQVVFACTADKMGRDQLRRDAGDCANHLRKFIGKSAKRKKK